MQDLFQHGWLVYNISPANSRNCQISSCKPTILKSPDISKTHLKRRWDCYIFLPFSGVKLNVRVVFDTVNQSNSRKWSYQQKRYVWFPHKRKERSLKLATRIRQVAPSQMPHFTTMFSDCFLFLPSRAGQSTGRRGRRGRDWNLPPNNPCVPSCHGRVMAYFCLRV